MNGFDRRFRNMKRLYCALTVVVGLMICVVFGCALKVGITVVNAGPEAIAMEFGRTVKAFKDAAR